MKTGVAIRGVLLSSVMILSTVAPAVAEDSAPPPPPPLPFPLAGQPASNNGMPVPPPLPELPDPSLAFAEQTNEVPTPQVSDLPALTEVATPTNSEEPLTPDQLLPGALEQAKDLPMAEPLPIPETPAGKPSVVEIPLPESSSTVQANDIPPLPLPDMAPAPQTAQSDVPPLPLPLTEEEKKAEAAALEIAKKEEAAAEKKAEEKKLAEAKPAKAKKKKRSAKKKKSKAPKAEAAEAEFAFGYHSYRLPSFMYNNPYAGKQNKHLPAAQFVEQQEHLLLQMAAKNDGNAVRALAASGVNIEAIDAPTGQTPLHVAARYNSVKALAALIGAGANIEAQDNWGKTAFYYAAQTRNPQLVDLLRRAAGMQQQAQLR